MNRRVFSLVVALSACSFGPPHHPDNDMVWCAPAVLPDGGAAFTPTCSDSFYPGVHSYAISCTHGSSFNLFCDDAIHPPATCRDGTPLTCVPYCSDAADPRCAVDAGLPTVDLGATTVHDFCQNQCPASVCVMGSGGGYYPDCGSADCNALCIPVCATLSGPVDGGAGSGVNCGGPMAPAFTAYCIVGDPICIPR